MDKERSNGGNVQRPTSNVQRPTSTVQRPTSNVQRPTSNVQRPTSNVQRPTSNVQRPTSNVQRPTSNVQLRKRKRGQSNKGMHADARAIGIMAMKLENAEGLRLLGDDVGFAVVAGE